MRLSVTRVAEDLCARVPESPRSGQRENIEEGASQQGAAHSVLP